MEIKTVNGKLNGSISLDSISFVEIQTAVIGRSGKNGRVYFPEDYIGKTVYILYPAGRSPDGKKK